MINKILGLVLAGVFLFVGSEVFAQSDPRAVFYDDASREIYNAGRSKSGSLDFLDQMHKEVWRAYVTPAGRLKIPDVTAEQLNFKENTAAYAVVYGERLFLFLNMNTRDAFINRLSQMGIDIPNDGTKVAFVGRGFFVDANDIYDKLKSKDAAVIVNFNNEVYEVVGLAGFQETTSPAVQQAIVKKYRGILATFSVNGHKLSAKEKAAIRELVSDLNAVGYNKILVRGHTDNSGTKKGNLRLSLNRAKVVYNELIRAGIPRNKISMNGAGAKNPVATNKTAAGKAKNRRAEVYVY